ncbi:hypothetical protein M0805_005095 [Coniferiporia weirii]|nr:hypothetical protein M0805_005095 [Coniferiporia weirii]
MENSAPDTTPQVDLILVFRSAPQPLSSSKYVSKREVREGAAAAEAEYTRLLETLRGAGLRACGKRGQKNGQLLVFVQAPAPKLVRLVQRERYQDFLRGLSSTELITRDSSALADPSQLSPADRLRIVYEFVTSTPHGGGLGIVPGSKEWTRVESVVALHDHKFNELWIHSWTRLQIGFGIGKIELDKIKNQFGEAVALYFAFLSSYTHSLMYSAGLGIVFYVLRMPYSVIYSLLLVLWSIIFVEVWRIRERELSMRWGTRGSFRVERRRAQYEDENGDSGRFPWWKRDARILASLPVISFFAAALAALLTGIFMIEAFVTQLYTGPGQRIISFSPTLLFVALVPQLLGLYKSYAVRLTNWENHAHQSTYEASLTLKTFALSAIVAYLGLALSAFVYVPFGEQLMASVARTVFATNAAVNERASRAADFINGTAGVAAASERSGGFGFGFGFGKNSAREVWAHSAKTDPARLQNQMFAYTVTNQAVNTFTEIGLPFITRKLGEMRAARKAKASGGAGGSASPSTGSSATASSVASPSVGSGPGKKNGKRVVFEDEERGEKAERAFLAGVRHELALPEYTLFTDYSEMVTQFGYVALWSTIWPLAPVMALLNNWLELRGDALKITTHCRRPIPFRTDTIGPWLETLSFIAWLSALTNAALVYLFHPTAFSSSSSLSSEPAVGTALDAHTSSAGASAFSSSSSSLPASGTAPYTPATLLLPALLLALSASHAHALARLFVRHVLERAAWRGSAAAAEAEAAERAVKTRYLRSIGVVGVDGEGEGEGEEEIWRRMGEVQTQTQVGDGARDGDGKGVDDRLNGGEEGEEEEEDMTDFWVRDEGIDEVQKAVKDS